MSEPKLKSHIRGIIKVKSCVEDDKEQQCLEISKKHIIAPVAYRTKKFAFDRVFGSEVNQADLFEETAIPIIKDVIDGYSCSVVAYGGTESGKSYSMFGPQNAYTEQLDEECFFHGSQAGIIPRALDYLLKYKDSTKNVSIRLSFFIIHGDSIFDLLANPDKERDSHKKKVQSVVQKIEGLEKLYIKNESEVFEYLSDAFKLLHFYKEEFNLMQSSFTQIMKIGVHSEGTFVITGNLLLVDLLSATEKTTKQTANKLFPLEHLQTICSKLLQKSDHIPYQDTTLTRVLKDCLEKSCKTTFIGTVSLDKDSKSQTLQTLNFISQLRFIEIDAQPLSVPSKTLIPELENAIENLTNNLRTEREIVSAELNGSFYMHPQSYKRMQIDGQTESLEKVLQRKSQLESIDIENVKLAQQIADAKKLLAKFDTDVMNLQNIKSEKGIVGKSLRKTRRRLVKEKETETMRTNEKNLSIEKSNAKRVELESTLKGLKPPRIENCNGLSDINGNMEKCIVDNENDYANFTRERKQIIQQLNGTRNKFETYFKQLFDDFKLIKDNCLRSLDNKSAISEIALKISKNDHEIHRECLNSVRSTGAKILAGFKAKLTHLREFADKYEQFSLMCNEYQTYTKSIYDNLVFVDESQKLDETLHLSQRKDLERQRGELIEMVTEALSGDAFDFGTIDGIISDFMDTANNYPEKSPPQVFFHSDFKVVLSGASKQTGDIDNTLNTFQNVHQHKYDTQIGPCSVQPEISNYSPTNLSDQMLKDTLEKCADFPRIAENDSLIDRREVFDEVLDIAANHEQLCQDYINACKKSTLEGVTITEIPQVAFQTPVRSRYEPRVIPLPEIPHQPIQDLSLISLGEEEE